MMMNLECDGLTPLSIPSSHLKVNQGISSPKALPGRRRALELCASSPADSRIGCGAASDFLAHWTLELGPFGAWNLELPRTRPLHSPFPFRAPRFKHNPTQRRTPPFQKKQEGGVLRTEERRSPARQKSCNCCCKARMGSPETRGKTRKARGAPRAWASGPHTCRHLAVR